MVIAQTHLNSEKPHVSETFKSVMKSPHTGFPAVNCVFAASDINFGTDRKRVGVLQMTVNNLATRTISQYSDPYGRFTSQTHMGKNGVLLTTIVAYQVGENSKGPASAYAQQRAMLVSQNRPAKPRALFIDDLIAYIQDCQLNGQDIVLCLDANDTLTGSNSGLRRLTTTCSLTDVHETLHPKTALPSHRRGWEKIVFIFVTPKILPSILRAGILPLDAACGSDHRLLFMDIDIIQDFNGITTDRINLKTRSFTTKNKKRTDLFRKEIQKEWTRRKLTARIKILSDLAQKSVDQISVQKTQKLWDKVGKEIGYTLEHSEQVLQIPTRRRPWSPELANAGIVKRYWKNRIANVLAGLDGQLSLNRIASQHNINDDHTQDIGTLEQRYDDAAAKFTNLAAQADSQRHHHLDCSIQALRSRRDKKSQATLRALKAIKMAEQQTQMFKKIRQF